MVKIELYLSESNKNLFSKLFIYLILRPIIYAVRAHGLKSLFSHFHHTADLHSDFCIIYPTADFSQDFSDQKSRRQKYFMAC